MTYFTHSFEATIVKPEKSQYHIAFIYLPKELESELPFDKYPKLRIEAEIGEYPLDCALQPHDGKRYMMLSKRVLKESGLSVGDEVEVRFRIADQDAVNVPEELQAALDADLKALEKWNALTPGKRRGFAFRVASAKRADTKRRRVEEILNQILP